MSELSLAQKHAAELLRTELYRHLDGAEFLAMKFEKWTENDTESARRLIVDLVATLRSVVSSHEETRYGWCRFCRGLWPCTTLQAVHRLLTDPDREFTHWLDA